MKLCLVLAQYDNIFVDTWMKDILYPGILAVMCWEIETLPCEGLS